MSETHKKNKHGPPQPKVFLLRAMTKKGLFQKTIKELGLTEEDFLWIDVIEGVEGERPKYAILLDMTKEMEKKVKKEKEEKSLNV